MIIESPENWYMAPPEYGEFEFHVKNMGDGGLLSTSSVGAKYLLGVAQVSARTAIAALSSARSIVTQGGIQTLAIWCEWFHFCRFLVDLWEPDS